MRRFDQTQEETTKRNRPASGKELDLSRVGLFVCLLGWRVAATEHTIVMNKQR